MSYTDTATRCPNCKQVVGKVIGGVFTIDYRGRGYLFASVPIGITCDKCGHSWGNLPVVATQLTVEARDGSGQTDKPKQKDGSQWEEITISKQG